MSQVTDFFTFILNEVPNFLLSDPIIYFVGLYFMLCLLGFLRRLMHIK